MPNMSLVVLTGHIGKAEELKYVPSGTAVLRFSLAVNTGFGEHKSCSWYEVSLWGKRAESLAKLPGAISKGRCVTVQGEISIREWESNGKKGKSADVRATDVILMGAKEDAQQPHDRDGQRENEEANPYHGNDQAEKDVPF